MPDNENKMIPLTGLWKSNTRSGGQMLSGNLSRTSRLVILQNKAAGQQGKDSDKKKPDYLAFLAPNNPAPNDKGNSGSGF